MAQTSLQTNAAVEHEGELFYNGALIQLVSAGTAGRLCFAREILLL